MTENNEPTARLRIERGASSIEIEGRESFVSEQIAELGDKYLIASIEKSAVAGGDTGNGWEATEKNTSLGEMFRQVDLDTKREHALFVGWFLERFENKEEFTTKDISERADRSKIPLGANVSRDLGELVSDGLLQNTGRQYGRQAYRVTRIGEEHIEQRLESP